MIVNNVRFSNELWLRDDEALVARIIAGYRSAVATFDGHGDSMWASINDRSRRFHDQLVDGETAVVSEQLRNPARNDLLCGFDEATATIYEAHQASDASAQEGWGRSAHQRLIRLAEAVGALPVRMVESGPNDTRETSVEAVLTALDERLGFAVDFPNPYPGALGVETSRGLMNHRALLAIYQAWRLASFAGKDRNARVLEIGAGSGRTAYYSRKFGIRDYTIIDLPLTNVAQANFLGRVLDPSLLVLSNEPDDDARHDRIRIFSPRWLENSSEHFDIALNADSMTEIDRRQAVAYFRKLAQQADVFVSINHETNSFRVSELPSLSGVLIRPNRCPYWLDPGYVEEVFSFRDRPLAPPDVQAETERLGQLVLAMQDQLKQQDVALTSGRILLQKLIGLGRQRARGLIGRE
jgi:hypothetical protein